MLRKLFNDEAGFVVSAELVLIVTLIFTAAAVGMAVARDALVQEFNDVSEMIGTLDQSYNVQGQSVAEPGGTKPHGSNNGMGFNDMGDACDCKAVTMIEICGKDQVGGTGQSESQSI
ncbi:MAG: hypothetical protein ACYTGL_08260 [Planctomycetota bacterium]|jgi:hypothetical protein